MDVCCLIHQASDTYGNFIGRINFSDEIVSIKWNAEDFLLQKNDI